MFSQSMNYRSILTPLLLTGLIFASPALLKADYDITAPGDTVVGIPDGSGEWPANEAPYCAIDNNDSTKYLHFKAEGESTGLKITPQPTDWIVVGVTFTTANDATERDPISFELYGSNDGINGTYSLIYSGPITEMAQTTPMPRFTKTQPILFNNSVDYDHYMVMFPDTRSSTSGSMQIAEIELVGTTTDGLPPVVDAGISRILYIGDAEMTMESTVMSYGKIANIEWELASAPAGIDITDLTFSPDRYAINPEITFPAVTGKYVLSLSATTENGSTTDTTTIIITDSLCPQGDVNSDCQIDLEDLEIIAGEWLNPRITTPDP
ncbi:MAG: hypothetical protein JXM68_14830, partial [Sedimentisphaerales bacterium]|nr:hypothetical protein [Sedimentisphaerales bacterium]